MATDIVTGQIVRIHYTNPPEGHDAWRWGIVTYTDDNSYIIRPLRGGLILIHQVDEEKAEELNLDKLKKDEKTDLWIEKPTNNGKPIMAKRKWNGTYKYPKNVLEVI